MKKKFKQLFSNTLIFAVGSIGSKFISFLLIPLYTYALTTSEYGLTEIIVTGTNLLIPLLSLSIQDAILRFGLDKKYNHKSVLKNGMIILFLGSIFSVVFYPIIKLYRPISNYALYFVILLILNMIRNIFSIEAKVVEKNKVFAIDAIIYTTMTAISSFVLMILMNMRIDGFFISLILSNTISIVFLAICCNIFKDFFESKFDKELFKKMVFFSLPLIINAISWWIVNSSDRIMLNVIINFSAVGIYSVAAKIPSIITNLTGVFNQAWMISSIKEYDENNKSDFYYKTFSGYHFLLIVCSALLIIMIKPFMSIYVNESFFQAWKYIPFLMMGSIFYAYANFFGAIYMSAKKNISIMVTTFLAAVVNILLNLVLIPKIGILGAVISTLLSYGIVGIYRLIGARKMIRFNANYYKVFFQLALLLIESILVMLGGIYYYIAIIIMIIILIDFKTSIISLIKYLFELINKKITDEKEDNYSL